MFAPREEVPLWTSCAAGCLDCARVVLRTACCPVARARFSSQDEAAQSGLLAGHEASVEASVATAFSPPQLPVAQRLPAAASTTAAAKGAQLPLDRPPSRGPDGASHPQSESRPPSSQEAGPCPGKAGKLEKSESKLSLLDDEDYCPTCLEHYTEDNPRVTARCGHSYHLPCIYEWMERSTDCPMCGQRMHIDSLEP